MEILIVDDDDVCLRTEANLLSSMGYKVDLAVDGNDAVEACKKKNYDLIFMDLRRPGKDGITACEEILELSVDKKPHIIAATGDATKESMVKCREAGMSGFISKPFNRTELVLNIKKSFPK